MGGGDWFENKSMQYAYNNIISILNSFENNLYILVSGGKNAYMLMFLFSC